jgi:hypothetical protein
MRNTRCSQSSHFHQEEPSLEAPSRDTPGARYSVPKKTLRVLRASA